LNGEDFDLDTVMHIYDLYYRYAPAEIYNALVAVIESDPYYRSICQKKDRCVRLNYKSDFHIDILPACMPVQNEREEIAIPEKYRQSWSSGNPKGFANWFLGIANSVQQSMLRLYSESLLEAKVESEPLPEELYLKTPLQRAVQLIKRRRDLYYNNRDYPVSSIVLTTLMARFYGGEASIFDAIDNTVSKILNSYAESVKGTGRFKIVNPVNPDEDFTDSWSAENYKSFKNFINDFYYRWEKLKNSFETSKQEYIELFGEGIYKKSLTEQFKTFSRSSNDKVVNATGLILGQQAYTDHKGQVNINQGRKNEVHHNFGE